MCMMQFDKPMPVVTPLGPAIAIYVTHNPVFEDDEWTCALNEGGQVRHFTTSQIKMWHNGTYGISKSVDMKDVLPMSAEAKKKELDDLIFLQKAGKLDALDEYVNKHYGKISKEQQEKEIAAIIKAADDLLPKKKNDKKD